MNGSSSSRYSRYFTYIAPAVKAPFVKNYATSIFTFLTLTIFVVFAIKPTVETILVLQKKLDNHRQVFVEVKNKTESLGLGKKNFENLDPRLKNQIALSIPDEASIKTLIGSFETMAQVSEATLSAIQIQPLTLTVKGETDPGKIKDISFIANLEGPYPSLVKALSGLKKSSRLILIESVSFNRGSEGSNLLMSVTGKVFYLKQ